MVVEVLDEAVDQSRQGIPVLPKETGRLLSVRVKGLLDDRLVGLGTPLPPFAFEIFSSFGLIHGRIGLPQEIVRLPGVHGGQSQPHRHADGGGLSLPHLEGNLYCPVKAGEKGRELPLEPSRIEVLDDDHELVAPQTGQKVVVPEHLSGAPGEVPKEEIPEFVAIGVVDRLEVVEVKKSDGRDRSVSLSPGQGTGDVGLQGSSVGESGEGIVKGLVFELVGEVPDLRDVPKDADKMAHLAGPVSDGADGQQVPEGAPVLGEVEDLSVEPFTSADGPANIVKGLRVGARSPEMVQGFSLDLFGRVSGDMAEGDVAVEDPPVRVGDGGSVGDGGQGGGEKPLPLGDGKAVQRFGAVPGELAKEAPDLGVEDVPLSMEEEQGPEGGSFARKGQDGQTPDGGGKGQEGEAFRVVVGAQKLGGARPLECLLPDSLNQRVRKKLGGTGHGEGRHFRRVDVPDPGQEHPRDLPGTLAEGQRRLFEGVGVRQKLVGPGEEGGKVRETGQPARLPMAQGDVQERDDGDGLSVDRCQGGRGLGPKFGAVLPEAMQFADADVRLPGEAGIEEGSDPKILRLVVIEHPRGEAGELRGGGVPQNLCQPPVGLHDGAIPDEKDSGHGVFKKRLPKAPVSTLGGPGLDPGDPQGDPSGELLENRQDLRSEDPGGVVVEGKNVSGGLLLPHGQDHKGPQSVSGEGLHIESAQGGFGSLQDGAQVPVDQGPPRGEGLPGGTENPRLLGVGGNPDPVEIGNGLSGSCQDVKESLLTWPADPGQGKVGLFHGQIADLLEEGLPVVGQGDLAVDLGQELGELRKLPQASLPGQPVGNVPGGVKTKPTLFQREEGGVDLHGEGRAVLLPVKGLEGEAAISRQRQGSGDEVGKFRGGEAGVPGRDVAPEELLRGIPQHLEEGAAGRHQGSLRVEDVDSVGCRVKQRGKGVKERAWRRFGGVFFGRSHGASLRGFFFPGDDWSGWGFRDRTQEIPKELILPARSRMSK